MCEILVCLRSPYVHPDAAKSRRGNYFPGDCGRVEEDGFVWGAKEGPPIWGRLLLPGVPAARVRGVLALDDADGTMVDEFTGQPTYRRRRRFRFDLSLLTNQQRVLLRNGVTLTTTVEQVEQRVREAETSLLLAATGATLDRSG